MAIIEAHCLSKNFEVSEKRPGLKGTIKHFFSRKTKIIRAVKSIDFKIHSGEIVGFIGANGAGKTTTLKMLCGLLYPSSGSLKVSGYTPVKRSSDFLEKISLVMGHKQQLIWDLPPYDSLRVNAAIYGLSELETKNRIKELSNMLELDEELYIPVRKLSLGQRMKAELLAALIHRPTILFLDEPTLGLDLNAQLNLRQFILNYNKIYGATILLTSHYLADITTLCKRVIIIDKGHLIYDDSLEKLNKSSKNKRIVKIKFIDRINIDFEKYGHINYLNLNEMEIIVEKDVLSNFLKYLLSSNNISDIEISDPPLEDLITDIFRSGCLE
tara:strand:- start:4330 stop:5310 length:981 start_codon:yes stop_codon:yes gene_type:complete